MRSIWQILLVAAMVASVPGASPAAQGQAGPADALLVCRAWARLNVQEFHFEAYRKLDQDALGKLLSMGIDRRSIDEQQAVIDGDLKADPDIRTYTGLVRDKKETDASTFYVKHLKPLTDECRAATAK